MQLASIDARIGDAITIGGADLRPEVGATLLLASPLSRLWQAVYRVGGKDATA
jgi:hypothetical protein